MDWLPWAPLGAASLHIFEEFVFPGGFATWYKRYRVNTSRITKRFLVIINAGLLVMCGEVALLGHTPIGIAAWLGVSALLCSNGCWHAWTTYKLRAYSPGVITGVTINAPLAVYGYIRFLRSGSASVPTALIAFVIGCSYPLWSAAYHNRHSSSAPG
jgi:hypothetical protein